MTQHEELEEERLLRLKSEVVAKLAEISKIQDGSELLRERSFIAEFKELKRKYQFSTQEAFALLDPSLLFDREFTVEDFFAVFQKSLSGSSPCVDRRHPKSLKKYRNPFTGEVIETKGFNNKKIREWKAAHGREEVESWREF